MQPLVDVADDVVDADSVVTHDHHTRIPDVRCRSQHLSDDRVDVRASLAQNSVEALGLGCIVAMAGGIDAHRALVVGAVHDVALVAEQLRIPLTRGKLGRVDDPSG